MTKTSWSARRLALFSLLATIGINQGAGAADAAQYLQDNCASCHALTKPDFDQLGVIERANRKGPLLYFAGDKYREDWLQAWLEAPSKIRPGGSFPPDHTVVTDEGDVIDESTLPEHPSVPAAMVGDVVTALMNLHVPDPPFLADPYAPQNVSPMLGKMNFNKFKGCSACHRDEEDNGGLSGPELYTAWNRLNPAFIISYIANPTSWDPHSMMPNKHLQAAEIHKLTDYLKLIGEQE